MTYTSIDQFLQHFPLLAQQAQSKLEGQNGHFCLCVTGKPALYLSLADGVAGLSQTPISPCDCTITADEQILLALLNGQLNPVKALLLRKVKVEGDWNKLLTLAKLA